MKNKLKAIFLLMTFSLVSSCQHRFSDTDQLKKYFEKNKEDYIVSEVSNGVKFTLKYVPPIHSMLRYYKDYEERKEKIKADSTLNELDKTKLIAEKKGKVLKREEELKNSVQFILNISYEDENKDVVYDKLQQGFDRYSTWLRKLLSGLDEKIYMETEKQTEVPLSFYNMERNYGLSKSRNLFLIFPNNYNESEVIKNTDWLKVHIKEFGLNSGGVTLKYDLPFDEVEYQL